MEGRENGWNTWPRFAQWFGTDQVQICDVHQDDPQKARLKQVSSRSSCSLLFLHLVFCAMTHAFPCYLGDKISYAKVRWLYFFRIQLYSCSLPHSAGFHFPHRVA